MKELLIDSEQVLAFGGINYIRGSPCDFCFSTFYKFGLLFAIGNSLFSPLLMKKKKPTPIIAYQAYFSFQVWLESIFLKAGVN